MQVNLLDRWVDEVHLEDIFVLDGVWGGVEFPSMSPSVMDNEDMGELIYHPVFCVSMGRVISMPCSSIQLSVGVQSEDGRVLTKVLDIPNAF